MQRFRRRTWLAASAFALALAGGWAQPAFADEVDQVLGRIAKARKGLKTLRVPFEQTRVIGLLASEVKSEGRLTIVSPDRLRWDLFPPDEVTYWIGPEGLAMRNEDGVTKVGKAAAGRFASVLSDLLVMIGGDPRKLRRRYDITVAKDGDVATLTAKPTSKDVKKHIDRLTMAVRLGEDAVVERLAIHEKGGDRSLIRFGTHQKNVKVDPDEMRPPS